jgi:ABC-2 type transport system ATP-binding protein
MSNLQPVSRPIAIRMEHVTQRFRVIHERPDSMRELFTNLFRNSTRYYDFNAVNDVSLEVPRGQMLGIIGLNGSGKSTLLKIISGIYRPTAGQVHVEGKMAPLIELGAGFHHELTGRENIVLNGLLMGYSRKDMIEKEQRIIDFAEIGDFIDAPIKQYSSGMHTRLAFAVATEVDPDILILDEVLAVGDMSFQQKCFERIRNFRRAGKTILFVTHAMPHVIENCDRVILMERGSMLADGDPAEVTALYGSLVTPSPSPATA